MHKLREHLHWWILGALCAGTVLAWYAVFSEDRDGKLIVAFLDVGQGDAIFIESPTGTQMLIDGGPDKSVLRQLGKVMPFYDRTIDVLVVTNPDKDHFAGFLDVLRSYKVGAVMEPGTLGAASEYAVLERLITEKGVKKLLVRRGQKIQLGDGAILEILFPDRDVSGLNPNEGSVVAKLSYGATSLLPLRSQLFQQAKTIVTGIRTKKCWLASRGLKCLYSAPMHAVRLSLFPMEKVCGCDSFVFCDLCFV